MLSFYRFRIDWLIGYLPVILQVVSTLQKLPMETIVTAAELEQETPAQLKQRLTKAGVTCNGCLEKQEVIAKVLEIGGSSSSSCSICCEDYVAGDVVRVLPCQHRYHIECVDRWVKAPVYCMVLQQTL